MGPTPMHLRQLAQCKPLLFFFYTISKIERGSSTEQHRWLNPLRNIFLLEKASKATCCHIYIYRLTIWRLRCCLLLLQSVQVQRRKSFKKKRKRRQKKVHATNEEANGRDQFQSSPLPCCHAATIFSMYQVMWAPHHVSDAFFLWVSSVASHNI